MAKDTMPLSILVVGGGVSGLIAALHFRQRGFAVQVLEQKSSYHDGNSGGGLSLTPNAVNCIDTLGLHDEFRSISDEGNALIPVQYHDGMLRPPILGQPRWALHRADLLNMLVKKSQQEGVEVLHGQRLDQIEESGERLNVTLSDGTTLTPDLLVGADGIRSKVRHHILGPTNKPPQLTGQATFLINIPRSIMEAEPSRKAMYEAGHAPILFSTAPGRSIVSWTMTQRQTFHMQVNDHAYGSGEAYNQDDAAAERFYSAFDDMEAFRKRWSDHGGAVESMFRGTKSCTKWLIAELPDLSTWSSGSGRIVLVGDAAHAFPPYAGQGACMAVEDATVLAVLVSRGVEEGVGLKNVVEAYERLRRPRIELIREVIKYNVATWSKTKPPGEEGWPDKGIIDRGKAEVVRSYDAIGEAEKYPLDSP